MSGIKFTSIVIDPPFKFSDKLNMSDTPRGADSNYHTLDLQAISNLEISKLADPNGCVLALWVPSSMLEDGLSLMKSWGFKYKQTYIWVKVKKSPFKNLGNEVASLLSSTSGEEQLSVKSIKNKINGYLNSYHLGDLLSFYMGHLFRQTHEICIIGINNTNVYKKMKNKSQRSVSFAINEKHSAKPEHLQDSLDMIFPNSPKLEVFARRQRQGWVCIGNEAPMTAGEDVRDSIKTLLSFHEGEETLINCSPSITELNNVQDEKVTVT